ncbi:hypothetical protein [Paraburkholderia sp. Ac-20347]|uniref:hypothetical protein n=1 Tax=Paraburkholderia sp. Ac-20347 TaxID=2703892 RepID=UPI00197EF70E|nr:hypothetical protein [Paraburkholderia sp. Ac-20347]
METMIRATKFGAFLISALACAAVNAEASCEATAKTRDDFLACTNAETNRVLSNVKRLYEAIRPSTSGETRIELDKNFENWKGRIQTDCDLLGKAFNNWGNDYTPDTDFQIAACRSKIANQQLEFYSFLTCADDLETSAKPKCDALKNALK